ncbi:MAG TPA: hypothetical protein VI873_02220 [Candidatus Peribacteraceae bacterium]|nr:hypothetical protein [Candidatus Peribacteraceae bacterium]
MLNFQDRNPRLKEPENTQSAQIPEKENGGTGNLDHYPQWLQEEIRQRLVIDLPDDLDKPQR